MRVTQRFLHNGWTMQNLTQHANHRMQEDFTETAAVVPGSVYTDLVRSGQMTDPFWKDEEYSAKARMEDDYEYTCQFEVGEQEYTRCQEVWLRFEGIDTLADIYLNDRSIGQTNNMHRIWEYPVQTALKIGTNSIRVILHSSLAYLKEAYQKYGNIGNEDTIEGFMHLRKAHYMFGWDWGACLPDAGIFRPVSLIGVTKARIQNVWIRQDHQENAVELTFVVDIEGADDTLHYEVMITDPDGDMQHYADSPKQVRIENPKLWWPNGYGEQPLYQVAVRLYMSKELVDQTKQRIGLRTTSIRREKDEWGESFAHEVNGIAIFAMGADYIPEDNLLGRTTRERTKKLLNHCKAANYNTVRVWGGGYYPEDWFYEICDELGLLVWQDFMFACSVYELTPAFEANIRQEFIDNIKRIRHHASLALWCGNNEMEMFVKSHTWVTKATEIRDYLFMYERIIPEVLAQYDPDTFYWPASPSSGGSFDEPNDPNRGDVHYWEVWHGNKPFTAYREHYFRYLSEFGFQALPAVKTLETVTDDPNDLNMFSYVMEKHQRNASGNGKIMNYMQQMYLYPSGFDKVVYASQLLQADGIRYGVEHFRRNRGRCMGAVYWQLNDCWPVVSWSSIDYYGRWKALHYYAKRFFAPIMISCEEESWVSAKADMNRQHFDYPKTIRLNVANETKEDRRILVRWAVRNADGSVLYQEEESMEVKALTSVWMEKKDLRKLDRQNVWNSFETYVSYEAMENGIVVSEGTVLFTYPKYFKFQDPKLACQVEGNDLIVTAETFAKSVEIQNKDETLLLSDNYFDSNAGDKRITIISGNLDGLHLRSVYDIR